jgi:hypothetical protein
MANRTLSLALACVVAAFVTVGAQAPPDFSGTWKHRGGVPDARGGGIRGQGNSPGGDSLNLGPVADPLIISQDDKALTVEEVYISTRNTVTYWFDGRTVTNQIVVAPYPATAPAEFTSRWKGKQLVSVFALSVPGAAAPRRYEQTMSLDTDGTLVVWVQAIGSANARGVVYRKDTAPAPATGRPTPR